MGPAGAADAAGGAWHYVFGNHPVGPLDDAAFADAYLNGRVTGATLVWWEGAPQWTRLADATRFAELDRWYSLHGTTEVGPMSAADLRAAIERSSADGSRVGEMQVRLESSGWVPLSQAVPLNAAAPLATPPPVAREPVEMPPREEEDKDERDPTDNSRAIVTVTPRVGVAFPGQATPREIVKTRVGFGFPFHLDAVFALGDYFELGTYFHYSGRPITERGTATTDGLWTHLVSSGLVAKVRFAVSKRSRMRIGATLGYNRVWQGFDNDTFQGTIGAHGLNVFPSIEWSHDVARRIAMNVQLAAISQVYGRADLGPIGAVVRGGSRQDMPFPPLAYLALGVDFCLGMRPDK